MKLFDSKEARKIISLSFPILMGSLSTVAIEFTDSVMAGHVSSEDLAGIAFALSIIIATTIPFLGFILAVVPIIARAHGASSPQKIVYNFWQLFWLTIFITLISGLIIYFSQCFFYKADLTPKVYDIATQYTLVIIIGLPALFFSAVLRALTDGMSYTKITMYVSFIALFINIILNYIFIYGKLGIPAFGGVGCAIATVIVQYITIIIQYILINHIDYFKSINLIKFFCLPRLSTIIKFFKLGFPIFVALFFEIAFFTFCSILSAQLGTEMIAANQIYYNVMTIVFMLPLTLSQVVSIRVGYRIGAKDYQGSKESVTTTLIIGLILAIFMAVTTYLLRNNIGLIYTSDQTVLDLVAGSFYVISLYQIADYCQVISTGALRGYKDNKILLYASLIIYWLIGAPFSYIFGISDIFGKNFGLEGLWGGLCLSLYLLAIIYILRIKTIFKKIHS